MKPQSHGLVFHGFFQSSQSHLLLPSRTLKAMIFFFLDFSKDPKVVVFYFMVFSKASKAPKVVLFLFLIFFQNSMAMVFFFLVKTSKSWSSFSWFFAKFPKSFSYFSPYLQNHGFSLFEFFQSSQSCCFHLGFSQSSTIVVFLCCFWLLVSIFNVLFNSLIMCNSDICELSTPPPHIFYFNN